MKKLKEFIGRNYDYAIYIFLFGCIGVILYLGDEIRNENIKLQERSMASERLTKVYMDRTNFLAPKIYELQKANHGILMLLKKISNKEKSVIIKYNEKIKVINKFGVSDMQYYFNSNFGAR